jgi:1-deoxy-D-xylulose-5-phosphate reductoisomerase
VVAETLERMDRTSNGPDPEDDAVERARNTDAEARRVADDVVSGLCAA